MAKLIGAFVAYKIVKQLAMPFEEWKAFKLGLIDKNGKTLKKAKTPVEKDAMDYSIRLVKNVKKIIEKLPFGKTRLGTLAAALFLLKEEVQGKDIFDFEIQKYINIDSKLLSEQYDIGEILKSGKYIDINTQSIYQLKKDKLPDESYMNVPLYKVKNIVTREYTIVSGDCIRRL